MAATDTIPRDFADWISTQRLFFVATAPLSGAGLLNCSPKGLDTLRILGPRELAYVDLTGSGVETIAHVRENGRIVLMFCAFSGPPRIVRIWGHGTVIERGHPDFARLQARLPKREGTRAILHIGVQRVAPSCGYGVPLYEFVGERDQLEKWAVKKGPAGLADYRRAKNEHSLDGLPGLSEP
jgi:hypothetical protein